LIVVPLGFLVAQITNFSRFPYNNFPPALYFFAITLGLPGSNLEMYIFLSYFIILSFMVQFLTFSFFFFPYFCLKPLICHAYLLPFLSSLSTYFTTCYTLISLIFSILNFINPFPYPYFPIINFIPISPFQVCLFSSNSPS
jgi:hypothetical protein